MMTPAWGAVERAPSATGRCAPRPATPSGATPWCPSAAPASHSPTPSPTSRTGMPRAASQRSSPSPGPQGFDPAGDPLGALLLERGYTVGSLTLNLTAAPGDGGCGRPRRPRRSTLSRPSSRRSGLTAYRRTRATVAGATEAVLLDSPRRSSSRASCPGGGLSQQLGLRDADAAGTTPIALARMGIGAGWAGLGAVWTDPAYRGRGLAAHLTARAGGALRQEDIGLIHLQVEHDNDTAAPPLPAARLRRPLVVRLPHPRRDENR